MRIVLVGPPGAGKGTQAQFIASHLAIPRISTGDIFRYNVTSNTELGRRAREFMERGDLVPDEVTVAMVRDRLAEDDAQEGEPLLHMVMQGGKRVAASPSLADIRARAARKLARLPAPLRRLEGAAPYPVEIGDALRRMAADVDRRLQNA